MAHGAVGAGRAGRSLTGVNILLVSGQCGGFPRGQGNFCPKMGFSVTHDKTAVSGGSGRWHYSSPALVPGLQAELGLRAQTRPLDSALSTPSAALAPLPVPPGLARVLPRAWGSGSAQPNTQTEAGRRILKRRQVLLIQENAPRLPSSRGNAVVGAEEVLPFGNLFLDVHSYPRRWSRGGGWQPHSVYTLEHVTWRLWFTGEWTSGLRLSGASVDTFPARTALGSSPRKRVPGA